MAEPYRVVDSKRVFEGRRFTVRHDHIVAVARGLTRREIAEKLGISDGRVGSAQDRLRKKVRKVQDG